MSDAIRQSLLGKIVSTDTISKVDNYQNMRLTETQKILKNRVNKASLKTSIEKEKLNKKYYENLEGLMLTMRNGINLIKKDSVEVKNTFPLDEVRYLSKMNSASDLTETSATINRDHFEQIEENVQKQSDYRKTLTDHPGINKTGDSNWIGEKKSILSFEGNNITKANYDTDRSIDEDIPQSGDKTIIENSLNVIKRKDIDSLSAEKKTSEIKNEMLSMLKNITMNQEAGRQTIKYKFSTWGSSHEVNIESSNNDTLLAYTSSDMVSTALHENQNNFDKPMYVYKNKDDNSNRRNNLPQYNVEADSDSDE